MCESNGDQEDQRTMPRKLWLHLDVRSWKVSIQAGSWPLVSHGGRRCRSKQALEWDGMG